MALLQEIQVPLLAVNDTSLTVVEINFTTGSKVKKGDLIMVFETSKTTYDVEAGEEGYIQYLCETDRDYEVNEVVARIYTEADEAAAVPAGKSLSPGESTATAEPSLSFAAGKQAGQPIPVRKQQDFAVSAPDEPLPFWEGETLFSREASDLIISSGIDKTLFAGRDFVSKWDVLSFTAEGAYIKGTSAAATGAIINGGGAGSSKAVPAKAVLPADPARVILERLSSGKKREIEYLGDVQSAGLTSTIHVFVDTENIFTHINRSLKYLKDSLLPVIIYEVSRLLADFPLLNAYFTGEAIARYKEVNAGFAIDIDKGLKVLKVPGAAEKSIPEIEKVIMDLSGSYLDDTLEIGDLTDITFTITDLSSEGVALFRPLINKMNSSILGVSAIDEKLQRCTLSLTFDHRVTEGKLAARFLKELKERLESYRANDPASVLQATTCFKCFKTLKEDLSGTGFTHCITPEGKEGYICQSCLKGF